MQEQREFFKREGIPPVRTAEYKPLYLDASSKYILIRSNKSLIISFFLAEAFEAYVPPEGDGKASLMSRDVSFIEYLMDRSNLYFRD